MRCLVLASFLALLRHIMIECGKSRWPVTVSTLLLLCQMCVFECQILLVVVKGGCEVSSKFLISSVNARAPASHHDRVWPISLACDCVNSVAPVSNVAF